MAANVANVTHYQMPIRATLSTTKGIQLRTMKPNELAATTDDDNDSHDDDDDNYNKSGTQIAKGKKNSISNPSIDFLFHSSDALVGLVSQSRTTVINR